jgi:hypothetical protein
MPPTQSRRIIREGRGGYSVRILRPTKFGADLQGYFRWRSGGVQDPSGLTFYSPQSAPPAHWLTATAPTTTLPQWSEARATGPATIAVLVGGLDHDYPAGNADLAAVNRANGLTLSGLPRERPRPGTCSSADMASTSVGRLSVRQATLQISAQTSGDSSEQARFGNGRNCSGSHSRQC